MEEVDKEISEMKLSLNARARVVAESYLSAVSGLRAQYSIPFLIKPAIVQCVDYAGIDRMQSIPREIICVVYVSGSQGTNRRDMDWGSVK